LGLCFRKPSLSVKSAKSVVQIYNPQSAFGQRCLVKPSQTQSNPVKPGHASFQHLPNGLGLERSSHLLWCPCQNGQSIVVCRYGGQVGRQDIGNSSSVPSRTHVSGQPMLLPGAFDSPHLPRDSDGLQYKDPSAGEPQPKAFERKVSRRGAEDAERSIHSHSFSSALLCALRASARENPFGCGWPRCAFCALSRKISASYNLPTTYNNYRRISDQGQSRLIKANRVIL
jgi:hypothetical protein